MKERLELRVLKEHAADFFAADEGERLGPVVRRIMLERDDPRIPRIVAAQKDLRQRRTFLYTSCQIERTYDDGELESAGLQQLIITSFFEPFGEECGTTYDECTACTLCGANATQSSALKLDLRKLGARRDIASTFAGEWVVSQSLANLLLDSNISGIELTPVQHGTLESGDAPERGTRANPNSRSLGSWYQLRSSAPPLQITAPSLFGADALIPDGDRYRCIYGDTLGLNQLSELTIERPTWEISDFQTTTGYAGVRRGLLRPTQLMLISPRLGALLRDNRIRGAEIHRAHYES